MFTISRILLLTALLVPSIAFAHGEAPLAEEVTGVQTDAGPGWVLRANFGVITSDAPDRYVCEEAFAGGDDFQVGVLGMNEWLVFTQDAVLYTADGCDFEVRQQLPKKVAAIAISDARERAAYLMNVDDAAERGIWWTADDGASFEQADFGVDSVHLTRAGFVGPSRLLVSAYSTASETRGEARLSVVNLDDGSAQALTIAEDLSYPYVLDVAGDWVVWLARQDQDQKVFWGPLDEPMRYVTPVDSWPTGAVLSPDGQRVWISGVGPEARGVIAGEAEREPVWGERVANHSALCVGRGEGAQYLCARRDREGHDLSRVGEDDAIAAATNFAELRGPRADCPADSDVATTCEAVWPELAKALDIEIEEPDGSDNPDDAEPTDATDAGCAVAPGSPRNTAAELLLLLIAGCGIIGRERS